MPLAVAHVKAIGTSLVPVRVTVKVIVPSASFTVTSPTAKVLASFTVTAMVVLVVAV